MCLYSVDKVTKNVKIGYKVVGKFGPNRYKPIFQFLPIGNFYQTGKIYKAIDKEEGISFFLNKKDAIEGAKSIGHNQWRTAVIKVSIKGIRQTGIWKGELSRFTAPAGHADEVTFLEEIKE